MSVGVDREPRDVIVDAMLVCLGARFRDNMHARRRFLSPRCFSTATRGNRKKYPIERQRSIAEAVATKAAALYSKAVDGTRARRYICLFNIAQPLPGC